MLPLAINKRAICHSLVGRFSSRKRIGLWLRRIVDTSCDGPWIFNLPFLSRLTSWAQTRKNALIVAAIVAIIFSIVTKLQATTINNDVWLADAWLHGHLWLAHFPGPWIDAMPYHGRAYIVEAPVPALLLLPFVAVFGFSTNQTILGIVLVAIAAYGAWRTGEYLKLRGVTLLAMTAFLVFGTSVAMCAIEGGVWFVAHLSAVAFTFLALAELSGSGIGWKIAMWAALAAGSRYPLLLALPGYALLIFLKDARGGQLRSFLGILAPVGVLFCAYNLARWNTLNDIGFSLWYRVMDPRAQSGRPPFGLDNLAMQVNAFFLHGPLLTSDFPYVRAEKFGLSLAWTSPALVLSIFARSPKVDVLIFWALAIATAAPAFLYYDLGGVQLGMRHALDFAPFLIVLLMFAIRNTLVERVFWLLALYSVLFGAYELVLWYQR